MADLFSQLTVFGISTLVMVLIIAGLYAVHRKLLSLYADKPAEQYRRQLIMLGMSLFGLVLGIVVIPVSDAMQGQLFWLLGILLSATIALSSTTLVGNAMAGLMLKSLRKIKPGCYIRTGEHFGRVSETDLLHTEIQTEDRDLTTLPNLYLVTNPVTVMRSSGTIISAEVSLGYDVPRTVIEPLLIKAATSTGLGDPFVQIRELGDFAVTYRIAGLAEDLNHLLAMKRKLRANTLDMLHEGGVEIVSPTFMNTRVFEPKTRFVSAGSPNPAVPTKDTAPDEVVFDKAEVAGSLELLREEQAALNKKIEEIEAALKDIEDDKQRRSTIFQKKKMLAQLARLEKQIYEAETQIASE
jgi:small conductance mechanosensitive channel